MLVSGCPAYDLAVYRRATSDASRAFLLALSASRAADADREDISAKAESSVRIRSAAAVRDELSFIVKMSWFDDDGRLPLLDTA